MVGHAGKADRAQEDGVMPGDPLEPIGRHHPAGPLVGLAAPVERVPVEGDIEAPAGGLENPQALGHHLLADSVARNDGDPMSSHGSASRLGVSPLLRRSRGGAQPPAFGRTRTGAS